MWGLGNKARTIQSYLSYIIYSQQNLEDWTGVDWTGLDWTGKKCKTKLYCLSSKELQIHLKCILLIYLVKFDLNAFSNDLGFV